jgi:hypothetical protein
MLNRVIRFEVRQLMVERRRNAWLDEFNRNLEVDLLIASLIASEIEF